MDFSHTDGLLGGMYAIENELYVPATGMYPVLFRKMTKFLSKTHQPGYGLKVLLETRISILTNIPIERRTVCFFTPLVHGS